MMNMRAVWLISFQEMRKRFGSRIHVRHDDAGITTLSIYDFLLNENALDL